MYVINAAGFNSISIRTSFPPYQSKTPITRIPKNSLRGAAIFCLFINLLEKFSKISKEWTPYIIGELNNQYVKLCKLKDNFVWHKHEKEDELFMVFKGRLYMDFRHQETVEVKEGEILIVPKGIEHRPRTNGEIVFNLLFEPKSTGHTGNVDSDLNV